MGGQGSIDNTQYLTHQLRIACKQKTQLKREAQLPLAHGLAREDVFHQQGRTLDHTACPTAWAEASPFATECDQAFMFTFFTP